MDGKIMIHWKLTKGYTVNRESGHAELSKDSACTLYFYCAKKGDILKLLDDSFEFLPVLYDEKVDETYIYTYAYQEEQNWSTYSGNIKEMTYVHEEYFFPRDCFFRIVIRKTDGCINKMLSEDLDINEIIYWSGYHREKNVGSKNVRKKFFDEEIKQCIKSVSECQTEESLNFFLITDSHYTVNGTWQDTVMNLSDVCSGLRDKLHGLIHLGDLTDGMLSEEVTANYVKDIQEDLQSISASVYYTIGNHDYNYFRGNPDVLSVEQLKSYYLKGEEQLYYHKDFSEQKLRMIFLDSFDPTEKVRYGYKNETLNYLEKVLLELPKDWCALVFSHVPPVARLHYWSDVIRGEDRLLHILKKYQRMSEGNLLGFVHGHNHADYVDYEEGFPIVSIGCSKCEYFQEKKPIGSVTYERKLNDVSQELWDIMSVSTKNRTLDFIRFGAGKDRHISNNENWESMRRNMKMKKVITYGTFDLFHEGHYNLLKRAKELGDYLIVGVTTEHYDEQRGKLNIVDSLLERIQNVQKSGFADEIIIEDHNGQKVEDIQKYQIDIFTLGSDWKGTYDYLEKYCKVVYLERTPDISSTVLRQNRVPIIRMGIVGTGRIAPRFLAEAKYVSGLNVKCAYNPNKKSAEEFAKNHHLESYSDSYEEFLNEVDAIYIASIHETHYDYAKRALVAGKHVLCEKPMVFSVTEAEELFALATEKKVVLMEGIKTAYCPGFIQMMNIAESGKIGTVCDVEACFSRITKPNLREMVDEEYGGAFLEFGSYTVLPILKLLGCDFERVEINSIYAPNGVDLYSKIQFHYKNGLATSKTGIGVKSEGQLVIAGTKGYILAESPWWLTKKFQVRYEDPNQIEEYNPHFVGDGLRYEIGDFVACIHGQKKPVVKLTNEESIAMARVVEAFMQHRQNRKLEQKANNQKSGVKIWAHRGCSGKYPENTIAAFIAACEVPNITGIELDVQLTKDEEVVVFHDETVDRLMDKQGNVCDYTLDELVDMKFKDWDYENMESVCIPTLKEVLQYVHKFNVAHGTKIQVNIELKNSKMEYPGMEEKVLLLVKECDMEQCVVYSSFNPKSLKKLKKLDKTVTTGILHKDINECIKLSKETGADAIHPLVDCIGGKVAARMPVRAWNGSEMFYGKAGQRKIFNLLELADSGVTDFITNFPETYL